MIERIPPAITYGPIVQGSRKIETKTPTKNRGFFMLCRFLLFFHIFLSKLNVMEIKEIVSYFLNAESNILEVSFRTIKDSEDVLRTDNIDYSISEEYGYVLESEDFGFYDDEFEDEEDYYEDPKIELDEEVLMSFLNEYYEVNPKSLPKPEYY